MRPLDIQGRYTFIVLLAVLLVGSLGLAACGPAEPADQLEREINSSIQEIIPRQIIGPMELEPVPGESEVFDVTMSLDTFVFQGPSSDVDIDLEIARQYVWVATALMLAVFEDHDLDPRIGGATFHWYDAGSEERVISVQLSGATRQAHRWGQQTPHGLQPRPIWEGLHAIADIYEDDMGEQHLDGVRVIRPE